MVQNQEIEIIKAIAEHLGLGPKDLDRNATLRDDLNLGPLELNDLLDYLREHFNVTFERDDIANLDTVSDLIVLVEDNLIE